MNVTKWNRILLIMVLTVVMAMGTACNFAIEEDLSESESVAESEKDLSGEYYNPIDGMDATTLSIQNNGDGTYAVDLGIFRLTSLEDGVGKYQDGIFTFTATDAAGNPITWQITDAGDHLVATVVDSTWEYLANQSTYEFYPIP